MLVCVFFNDPATTEIYTLSLHDALPIAGHQPGPLQVGDRGVPGVGPGLADLRPAHEAARPIAVPAARVAQERLVGHRRVPADRKSTRLNSSHANISYAVFCLKKKTKYFL